MRLLCIVLAGILVTGSEVSGQPAPYQISVDVDLVVLHVTVRDRKGAVVTDLAQSDFQVYEDGVRQRLSLFRHEDMPVTVGLVVDHSGSMRPKMTDVIAAARTFVRLSNPNDQMFVVNFNEEVAFGLPKSTPFTNRIDEMENAVAAAAVTGKTALYDAVAIALGRLQTSDREKKALVVISDGGDNASRRGLEEVIRLMEQSNALVYTVGIFLAEDPEKNPDVLRRFARVTGGEAYFPREVSDVVEACERIARDIRNQYTLGYVSTNTMRPPAGKAQFRRLRVVAEPFGATSKYSVRARAGYALGESVAKTKGTP